MNFFEVAVDFECDNSMVFYAATDSPEKAAEIVRDWADDSTIINIEASLVLEVPKFGIMAS